MHVYDYALLILSPLASRVCLPLSLNPTISLNSGRSDNTPGVHLAG